jgi:hypothetical protein
MMNLVLNLLLRTSFMYKMKQWTKEWYQVCSMEELFDTMSLARESLVYLTKTEQNAAILMWKFRLQNLQEEIAHRQSSKPVGEIH